VLVKKEVDGASLRFTNGVEIDQVNGEVYFTDSSMNYQRSLIRFQRIYNF
jgi:hypothetical protein